MSFPCAACGSLLWVDDFERGKAVLIGDLPYCAACKSDPKPASERRGKVPIFAIPTPPPMRLRRPRRGRRLGLALLLLAAAAALAWFALRP